MFCLDPPLDSIPKDQWYCFTCLSGTGGDFGFDEGEEHSLSSFQARDKEFRRLWFESHPPANDKTFPDGDVMKTRVGNITVSEYDVEEEFWRLVQSPHETVEIEYGADVHSTTHGRYFGLSSLATVPNLSVVIVLCPPQRDSPLIHIPKTLGI
jgi:histone demethylase JARID1